MIVGIGIDIVEIARIRRAVEGQSGARFVDRIYTAGEAKYCRSQRDPVPHFAARFAAKEALFKALGTGWAEGVTWRDVEVTRSGGEAPELQLRGAAAARSRALGTTRVHVTLSHSDTTAVAVVVLEKDTAAVDDSSRS